MKRILFALFVLISVAAKAQSTITEVTGNPYLTEGIIKTDSALTQSQLYTKGLEFFTGAFVNANAIIQLQDKDQGMIIGKGTIYAPTKLTLSTVNYKETFTLKLQFKNGRIKYSIYDYNAEDGYGLIKDGKPVKFNEIFGHAREEKIYHNLQVAAVQNNAELAKRLVVYFTKKTNTEW